ncbi:putative bifunctional diguanylate cyclase/phosphodiesterase [Thaumasiovibrio subtropicus]|uniref:putative bifunctional diguanylate cyclase/phosphodiesterase n=1 Tax=Thaumasiovibrio subtropicus TaxID=1891207 RepID=UPI000B354D25|nr:EAL domain-containing protein [Thaumasiovibrio subtropicus]
MRLNLRLKTQYLSVTLTLILLVTGLSASTYLYFSHHQAMDLKQSLIEQNQITFQREIKKRGEQIASYLSTALFDPLYHVNLEEVKSHLTPIITLGEVDSVIVFDSEGYIFHDGTDDLALFGQPFADQALAKRVLASLEAEQRFTASHLIITTPIVSYRSVLGGLHLELSLDKMQSEIAEVRSIVNRLNDESNQALFWSVCIAASTLFAIATLLAFGISTSLTRPLQNLARHAERLGSGRYTASETLAEVKRQDEIGELATALNAMAEKIELRTNEISFLAYHDTLTELPNRIKFTEHIQAISQQYPPPSFAVLFIDLDEFKRVNDNHGHELGDRLLCRVARRLSDYCETYAAGMPEEAMVARIGGDEFLMLLPLPEGAISITQAAEDLFKVIREPIQIKHDEFIIGGSIGIAIAPDAGQNADELIKNADIAMYCAKAAGKNTFRFFTQEMNEAVVKRAFIEKELRRALNDPTQFELWYQPLIDLSSGHMIGAEALVRWRHPDMGLIPPIDFIDVAEDTGMIVPIGEWLITHLCQQLAQWQPYIEGDFHVALNLSCKQLYHPNLSHYFLSELEHYQIPTALVHLEITESMLFRDEGEAEKTLMTFHEAGVQVWLDDFGTGYSSLSYLRRFQVSGFKIDRSFIMNLENDKKDQNLVQAMVAMAKNLDLKIVAEGIESKPQITLLKAWKCDFGQGYYYAKPLPANQFTRQLLTRDDSPIYHS